MVKQLKKLSSSSVKLFKIKNRRGYAAIALNNLTEGKSPSEAFDRMIKAMKRSGFQLSGKVPTIK